MDRQRSWDRRVGVWALLLGVMIMPARCGRPIGTDGVYQAGWEGDDGAQELPLWPGAVDEPIVTGTADSTPVCAVAPVDPSDAPAALDSWRVGQVQVALPQATSAAERLLQTPPGLACEAQSACGLQACRNTSACGGGALTFSQVDVFGSVEGFVAVRAALATSPAQESTQLYALLLSWLGPSRVTLVSAGVSAAASDGSPGQVSVTVELSGLEPQALSVRRDRILATLLGLQMEQLEPLPATTGPQSGKLVLSYGVQARPGANGSATMVFMGAITPTPEYHASACTSRYRLQDAANNTALAGPDAVLRSAAEQQTTTAGGKADIIWVIDESGSMDEERENVAANAVQFFNMALEYGLDFRMGVVNVNLDGDGIFCTGHNESLDHFLGPGDLNRFSQCARSPWGAGEPESGAEFGISQGYKAIVNHLPRAHAPNRIRPDAAVALIYVSDELANELFDPCGYGFMMDAERQLCIQQVIQPTVELLLGGAPLGGGARAHAIVGPRPYGCDTADAGDGYLDIVAATGGMVGSICQPDLHTTLRLIIEDIIAAASPITLVEIPVTSSLRVQRDGVPCPRQAAEGFDYRASSNALILRGQATPNPEPVALDLHYHYWSHP